MTKFLLFLFSLGLFGSSPSLGAEPHVIALYPSESKGNINRANQFRCMTHGVFAEAGLAGTKIRLQVVDYEQNADSVAKASTEVVKLKPDIVIGTLFSKEAIVAGNILNSASIPFLAPTASNPQVVANKKNVYSLAFSDERQIKALVTFTKRLKNVSRISIIKNTSDPYSSFMSEKYGALISNSRKKPKIEIFEIIEGFSDFEGLSKKISQGTPDLVFLPLYHPQIAGIYKGLKNLKTKTVLLGGDTVGGHQIFIEMLGGISELLPFYFTKQWDGILPPRHAKNLKRISEKYCGGYANPITLQHVAGFDAANVAIQYIRTRNFEAIQYDGVMGKFKFGFSHFAERDVTFSFLTEAGPKPLRIRN